MIFVTVGIGGSDEIVKKIDELAPKLDEDVVVLLGGTNYIPKNCKWLRLTPSIIPYVKKSRLVITHGGAGTIFECLTNGARIITIAKKHVDNHQVDIIDELSKNGYIIKCGDLEDLEKCIRSKKQLKKYATPKSEIADKIIEFLEKIN